MQADREDAQRRCGQQDDRYPEDASQAVVLSLLRILHQVKRVRPGSVELPLLWVLHTVSLHEPVRVSELASRLSLDLSTVSRHVSALQSGGMAQRTPDPDDRRAWLVSLTEEGRHRLRQLFEQRRARLTAMVSDWPEDELATFERLLGKLADRLDDDLPEPAQK